ncbi:MAG: hypothetical protein AMXMBFR59_36980 [Rhodanobacteraceae bacterium]
MTSTRIGRIGDVAGLGTAVVGFGRGMGAHRAARASRIVGAVGVSIGNEGRCVRIEAAAVAVPTIAMLQAIAAAHHT